MRHVNLPQCSKCVEILNRYPNIHPQLATWALSLRAALPEAHISCAGRGKEDQEADYAKGVSRARWGESPHNYNAAIDWFRITQARGASFEAPWYRAILGNLGGTRLVWGGTFKSLHDLPHVEWASWREDAKSGLLQLVETKPV